MPNRMSPPPRPRVAHSPTRPLALLALLILIFALAACGGEPEPTPTPTKTPIPAATDTPIPPTDTPIPPTDTPVPPTDTPIPATDTPEPAPTDTPAPAEELAAAPAGPPVSNLDPNIWPFTGLPADPAQTARRPIVIKASQERAVIGAQSGLSKADVVVESRVEFNMVRFSAVFHSQDTERLGPIRSARLIDLDLPVIFDAALAFSGAVEPIRQKIYGGDLSDRVMEQALNGSFYQRDTNLPVPHNLFANTATLRTAGDARGWNVRPNPTARFYFSAAVPDAPSASALDVPYPDFKVRWTWDAGSGRWLRFIGLGVADQPHIDASSGEQLSVDNIALIGANHVATLILEHGTEMARDNAGNCVNCSIEIQIWGEGPLTILRDGRQINGTWVRDGRFGEFHFLDANGNDIPLKPGNSWWQVVPLNMNTTITP